MTVIEIRDLTKRYGDRIALAGVDLTVEAGEIVGLVGPNGAGKTTTVECVSGLRRPDAGRIRVLGLEPTDRRLREVLGVQLQEAGLPDRLTTGDPSGPYGCCILALSAKAPHAIQGWNGGDRIAIHSTPDTGSIGLPVSHGCLRLTLAEGRWLIDHIPLGTPTIISSA